MASEPGKRPVKGILKHTSSLDKTGYDPSVQELHRREVEWDEMNILATHHPPGKEYGHMKIDEPPTPYNKYSDAEEDEEGTHRRGSASNLREPGFDPSQLMSRLAQAEDGSHKTAHIAEESSSEDESETPEERAKRKQFELKRKMHYNEFAAVQLAKKLMQQEVDEDEEDEKTESSFLSQDQSSSGIEPGGEGSPNAAAADIDNDVCMASGTTV